jgi:alkylation response protein AidB-like acyl-CoA dehydrogenase
MDFRFSPEDEAFRREIRDFVKKEWDDHGYDLVSTFNTSYHLDDERALELQHEFERKLVEKGWWTMHWPVEYGGQAAPITRQLVYREEMAYQGAPAALGGGLVAPLVMLHGTQWQKEFFIPKLANAELEFAQGFSEPNAGSDLANLQTRAVQDGDDYVINGQKIWTSTAHHPRAKWGHILVRTDPSAPKHRGISYFFIDMASPGISLRPLYDMVGRRRWSEWFLEDVRVPARNLIGELNRGWYAAMTTLSFERASVDIPASLLRGWEQLVDWFKKTRVDGVRLTQDPIVRHQLADLRVYIEMGRMLAYRVAWMQSKGLLPEHESSIARAWAGEATQTLFRTGSRLMREMGTIVPGGPARWTPMGGYVGANYFLSTGRTFGGGAKEIQKNIIAQRGLGLPR